MRSNIFFPLLIAIMVGCGLGSHFFESIFYHTFEIFIAGIIALLLWLIILIIQKKWSHIVTIPFSVFLFSVSLVYSANYAVHARDQLLASYVNDSVTIEGVVTSDPQLSGDRQKFTLRAERINEENSSVKVTDKVLVSLPQYPAISYGDKISITTSLQEPEPFATEYGRMFAYDNYLRSQGIGYTMFANEYELIDTEQVSKIIAKLFVFKHILFNSLSRFMHAPYESIARAMVFGDTSGIPDDMQTAFQKTGLIHIMVLSGYNITIIAVALLAILRPLGRKIGISVSVVAIILFLLMTGLTPTSLRAGIMGGIGLLALGTFRRSHPLRALFLAGAIMAIINPFLILESVSFQLSFLATLGLILLSPLFSFVWIPGRFGLREIIAATLATQVAVLPILMGTIGMVSLVGIVMNLIVVPWVPVIMAGTAFIAVGGLFMPIVATSSGIPVEYILRGLVWLVTKGTAVPVISFAHITTGLAFGIGCLISTLIIALVYFIHRRQCIDLVY